MLTMANYWIPLQSVFRCMVEKHLRKREYYIIILLTRKKQWHNDINKRYAFKLLAQEESCTTIKSANWYI